MIRIGELSRKTSTSPELLRAWELRYGLLQPQRTAGGLRLYNDADIAKVRAMKRLIAAGIAPAQAAEQLLAGGEAGNDLPNDEAADPGAAIHRSNMLEAIDALDTTQVQRELDLVLARLSVGGALEQVVLPVMRALGVASSDALGIAQEHLFTNAVRGRLNGLARTWDEGSGERVVLACPPREQHDLPLLMFGLALRERGRRIVFLGANTPIISVIAALDQLDPPASSVVLSAMTTKRFQAAHEPLIVLARATVLYLAGRGATEDFARSVGATVLSGSPIEAARSHW